ncbi:MAG: cation transporter [Alphaproteobacteria bacterium]|nr:cation transporter [Alphaproteobacteria bacterium]
MTAAHAHHHHGDDHDHPHGHGHGHGPASFDRAFAFGVALNVGFVAIEVAAGLLTNSLALLADAGHNLSDVLGLILAWAASWAARQPATRTFTYGYRRSSILASLANAGLLLIAVGVIAAQAVARLGEPQPVATGPMIWVAAAGVLVNGVTAWLFHRGQHDLNIRGAYLHMAADAAVSAGVVVAALAIGATGWFWIDPAVSLVIAAVIAAGTWGLLREATRLSLDAAPAAIDVSAVEAFLAARPGVTHVHHVHVWATSTTEVALTAHLVRPDGDLDDAFLRETRHALAHDFGIGHATLQVERGACPDGC